MADLLTFYKIDKEEDKHSIPATLGMSDRMFRKLLRDLGLAIAESMSGREIDDGIYSKCKSPTETLQKYITTVDIKEKFGLDIDTLNGSFILGFALFEAMHGVSEAHEAAGYQKVRKILGNETTKEELKKLLDDL